MATKLRKRGRNENKKGQKSKKNDNSVVTRSVKSKIRRVVYKKENIKANSKKEKKRRNNYTPEALQQAVKAASKGASFRKAARMYGVPVTIVFRAVKTPKKEPKYSTSTVLSTQEEEEVCNWVLYRAERGYPVTKNELLDSVQSYVTQLGKATPFTDGRPGRHWYEAFLRRYPNLAVRTAQHLTLNRALVTEEDCRNWFEEIRIYLENKNLLTVHPSRVYNCDETNMQLLPKPDRVLTQKGTRSVYKVVGGNEKESLTALFMYNAEGSRAPPMIMYKYKGNVPKKILENCPSGWA